MVRAFFLVSLIDIYKLLEVLVLPLWKEIARIFPGLQMYPDQIELNLKRIDEEKAKV